MSDRVTNSQLHRSLLRNINSGAARVAESQAALASGRSISKPSDNPLGTSRAMAMLTTQDSFTQYESNLGHAKSWVEGSETALSQVNELIQRARTLALQAASDGSGPGERAKIAQELTGIIDGIKTQGNTKLGEEFIFAGTASQTQPYTLGPGDAYAGNAGQVMREIAPGVQLRVNEVGSSVFGDNTTGLLKNLRDLVTHMTSGVPGDIDLARGADLVALDVNADTVLNARARLGELQSRVEFNLSRLGELKDSNAQLLANVRDTDYAQTTIEYMSRQAIFEAALKTAQGVVQPSLVTFLSG
jgi:flagellar hook-associated protein 3 FlgL